MIRGQHKDLVQPTVKTAPITAALLGMAAYTFAAAELNVAQMLILNDRANNNANTIEQQHRFSGRASLGRAANAPPAPAPPP